MVIDSEKIEIYQVKSNQDRKKFVQVPFDLHQGKKDWVFPLKFDSLQRIDPKHNPFFEFGEAAFWIAMMDGKAVGRISAQINHRHLDHYQDATGQFGYIDAIDEPVVFAKLLATAENWLLEKGMKHISGPFNLSINEECGLLIDGYEHPPMILMPYNPPYYGQRLEECGLQKLKDLYSYGLRKDDTLNPRSDRIMRAAKETQSTIRPIDMKNLDQEIKVVFDIFQDAWADNWGFVPFSEGELKHMAASMKMILTPELALIAEIDGKPSGMLICLPNINEAIADLNGNLLPFGWAKLLWRLKVQKLKTGRAVMTGMKKEHHGTIVGMSTVAALLETLKINGTALNMEHAELSWILEDNKQVNRLLQMGGYQPDKTYRIYGKALVDTAS